jgi:ABC-type multidrug transport system ATPase subunit
VQKTNEINQQQKLTGLRLINIGKKFRDQWIFRGIDLELTAGDRLVINGLNGSGKSTLLQLIAGYITPTEGKIIYNNGVEAINPDKYYRYISFAAPYLELIEQFTLKENVDFFRRHKPLQSGLMTDELISRAGLTGSGNKQVRNFSSGMKQRVRLALSLFAATPLILLDEPLSNLDMAGYEWYTRVISELSPDKIIIVCSNQVSEESFFCKKSISL